MDRGAKARDYNVTLDTLATTGVSRARVQQIEVEAGKRSDTAHSVASSTEQSATSATCRPRREVRGPTPSG